MLAVTDSGATPRRRAYANGDQGVGRLAGRTLTQAARHTKDPLGRGSDELQGEGAAWAALASQAINILSRQQISEATRPGSGAPGAGGVVETACMLKPRLGLALGVPKGHPAELLISNEVDRLILQGHLPPRISVPAADGQCPCLGHEESERLFALL